MTTTARNLRLLLVVLLALCLPACKHGSTLLSNEPIKPQPPRVSCKQLDTSRVGKAPRADEWAIDGQLSERAVNWIASVLGVADKRKELLDKEHACLDEHEKRGDIQQ